MRGKALRAGFILLRNRITPAYAGKSSRPQKFTELTGDHPRLCGEKSSAAFAFRFCAGSPPPMRGKVRFSSLPCSRPRITPAYAGKSGAVISRLVIIPDHPRLCGEKGRALNFLTLVLGSPPPMRGKGVAVRPYNRASRITPAYAGKRALAAGRTQIVRDHPRLCGEKRTGVP